MTAITNASRQDARKPPPQPPFMLHPVKRDHAPWRFIFPFLSEKSFWTLAILLGAALPVTACATYAFGDPGMVPFLMLGGFVGAMCGGPYPCLPALLIIESRVHPQLVLDTLPAFMRCAGYKVDQVPNDHGCRYYSRWRDRHVLLNWEEMNIDVSWTGNVIVVRGPIAHMKMLRQRMQSCLLNDIS